MKIIALIPSYGNREYLPKMLAWLKQSGEVDVIITLIQDVPLGASNARRQLIEEAFAKHGKDALYLMLDDDCKFTNNSKIRKAAKHFEELKGLGIVMIPGYLKDGPVDQYYETVKAYHCFLISGAVLAEGINYSEDEYCDELDFALKTWLAGYRNIISYRAIIWHHAEKHADIKEGTKTKSATIGGIKEGKIEMKSTFIKTFGKQFKFTTQKLFNIDIPEFFSIAPNKSAREQHEKNKKY